MSRCKTKDAWGCQTLISSGRGGLTNFSKEATGPREGFIHFGNQKKGLDQKKIRGDT